MIVTPEKLFNYCTQISPRLQLSESSDILNTAAGDLRIVDCFLCFS